MASGDVGIDKSLAGRPDAAFYYIISRHSAAPHPFLLAHGDSRNREPAAVRVGRVASRHSHVQSREIA